MSDATYPLFPFFAFLGFVLSLIPLPWHLHAWNSGTCYYMMWASLACLNQFVNSIVWHNNAFNPTPFWCEISIRIMMGATVGLPLSSMCISRRLYHITSSQTVSINRAQKTRAVIVDTALCVGVPVTYIALQYIVQGHRFNIYEDIGCFPAVYNTLITFFLTYLWPVVIGMISATYCVLSLRSFAKRRLEFSQFINSSSSSLTMSRYFRLMALAATEIVLTTPLAIFVTWVNAKQGLEPWRSWDDTHLDYSRIEQVPAFFWKQSRLSVIGMEFTRWAPVLCALVFFAFFGFADEAKKNYKKAFWKVAGLFGLKPAPAKLPTTAPATIGHYQKPKSPISPTSFAASSQLPPYSPDASSFYPLHDVKKTECTSTVAPSIYSASNKDDASTASILQDSHDRDERSKRFSWKSILLPATSRRYSSYL